MPDGPTERDSTGVVIPAKARPRHRMLPPYKVLLHNDDVNDMLHVVEAILELTTLTTDEAVDCMLEAHHQGSAVLLITHRERAELYCEQFATFKLTVTTEPDM